MKEGKGQGGPYRSHRYLSCITVLYDAKLAIIVNHINHRPISSDVIVVMQVATT